MKAGDRVVATGRSMEKLRNALRSVVADNLEILQLDVSDEARAAVAVAGSDALAMIAPAVDARLKAVRAFEALSKATDGSF